MIHMGMGIYDSLYLDTHLLYLLEDPRGFPSRINNNGIQRSIVGYNEAIGHKFRDNNRV